MSKIYLSCYEVNKETYSEYLVILFDSGSDYYYMRLCHKPGFKKKMSLLKLSRIKRLMFRRQCNFFMDFNDSGIRNMIIIGILSSISFPCRQILNIEYEIV